MHKTFKFYLNILKIQISSNNCKIRHLTIHCHWLIKVKNYLLARRSYILKFCLRICHGYISSDWVIDWTSTQKFFMVLLTISLGRSSTLDWRSGTIVASGFPCSACYEKLRIWEGLAKLGSIILFARMSLCMCLFRAFAEGISKNLYG